MVDDQHGQNGAKRFMFADDVSDSEEREMDLASSSDMSHERSMATVQNSEDNAEEPPRKKLMQEKTTQEQQIAASLPKWSNPDPYTILPPPDESRGKKKDVIKLIRKARVEAKPETSEISAAVKNDDFISLDFVADADDTVSEDGEQDAPRGAPKQPKAFSHRDSFHGSATHETTRHPAKPLAHDVWPPPSKEAAVVGNGSTNADLGSRKRTHDDEIKRPFLQQRNRRPAKGTVSILNTIRPEWRATKKQDATPWLVSDHSGITNMGFW